MFPLWLVAGWLMYLLFSKDGRSNNRCMNECCETSLACSNCKACFYAKSSRALVASLVRGDAQGISFPSFVSSACAALQPNMFFMGEGASSWYPLCVIPTSSRPFFCVQECLNKQLCLEGLLHVNFPLVI